VLLFDAGPLGGAANYSNGFLPAPFQPTRLRDKGTPVLDLLPPEEFAAGQRDSLDLIRQLNLKHRATRPGFTELDARIASYELAYRMQSAALEVGNLDSEPAYLKQSYGLEAPDNRTAAFGRKCLLARRLVERGVRFVQLYDMPDKDGWDAHEKLLKNHQDRARWTDQSAAALLDDLKQRGLLDSTLVVWASEFGRTPMMQGNSGRQHNAAGFTIWLAGGGVQPGSIGATDELGIMAVEQPHQIRDLHATILTALGIAHEDLSFQINGRQERLTGVAGSAGIIPGVLG
jgi:arylsulfatase A-like enzyme